MTLSSTTPDAAATLDRPAVAAPAITRHLTIGHLYGDSMNIYGDRGNTLTLAQRCRWRGIGATIVNLGFGDRLDPDRFDLLFVGGGQDREQVSVARDLQDVKGAAILTAVARGAPLLAICGGYQLLGHEFRTGSNNGVLPGIGLFDAYTVGGTRRLIGNVVVELTPGLLPAGGPPTLVGFENHSGQTFLGRHCRPLGRAVVGGGNNGEDGFEGGVDPTGLAYGSYLHGSLLPKNPHLADHLIRLALRRRGEAADLAPLDDDLELRAHTAVVDRARQLSGLRSGIRQAAR